jgi:hypothetical protein
MAMKIEQVAAHEAGHAVVGMALGVPITAITGRMGRYPGSLLGAGVFETFATDMDTQAMLLLEPRQQYLVRVAGFAGELAHCGVIEPRGALDDLTRLRDVGLTNAEILVLTDVAEGILKDNRRLWERVYSVAFQTFSAGQTSDVPFEVLRQWFTQIEKRFTDTALLERLLPE